MKLSLGVWISIEFLNLTPFLDFSPFLLSGSSILHFISGQERGLSMVLSAKEIGASSSRERAIEVDDDASISTTSTIDFLSSTEEVQSIHQTLSRNAGLEEPDKSLAHITTVPTNMTTDPQYEIDFDEGGENPQGWSMAKKGMIIFFMSFSTLVVVMYSTSYSAGIPGMMATVLSPKYTYQDILLVFVLPPYK